MRVRLGQCFLNSKKIVRKIVEAAGIQKEDVILEVGPGRGILTEELLKYAKKVIAVEKDKRLTDFLTVKFGPEIKRGSFILIEGDIFKISNFQFLISKQILNSKSQILNNYKIVANIPYYITSRFLRNFLTAENQPQKMILMLQKEVARRICVKPPKMNLLAISVQAYGEPKILFNVPRKYFSPSPKVDSAVVKIENISKKFFHLQTRREKEFFKLVKTGFRHKRKLLLNNLRQFKDRQTLEEIFKHCEIPLKSRSENLSLSNWRCLRGVAPQS